MAHSEKLRIVQEYWEAERQGDLPAVLDHYTDDAEFKAPGYELHGRDEVKRFYESIMGQYKDMRVEVRNTIEDADRICVEYTFHYTRNTGKQGLADGCNVFRLRDGKICQLQAYFNPSEY